MNMFVRRPVQRPDEDMFSFSVKLISTKSPIWLKQTMAFIHIPALICEQLPPPG